MLLFVIHLIIFDYDHYSAHFTIQKLFNSEDMLRCVVTLNGNVSCLQL